MKCPQVHCYLQLVAHTIIDDEKWCEVINNNLSVVRGLGLQTILVVTRYDEMKELLTLDPYTKSLENEMKEQRKKFSQMFGVPYEYVRFLFNYHGRHTELNFNIDKNIYEILIQAMDIAKNQVIILKGNGNGTGEIIL